MTDDAARLGEIEAKVAKHLRSCGEACPVNRRCSKNTWFGEVVAIARRFGDLARHEAAKNHDLLARTEKAGAQLKRTADLWQEESTRLAKERDAALRAYRNARAEADALRGHLQMEMTLNDEWLKAPYFANQTEWAEWRNEVEPVRTRVLQYRKAALAGAEKAASGEGQAKGATAHPNTPAPAAVKPAKVCHSEVCERLHRHKCCVDNCQQCEPTPAPPEECHGVYLGFVGHCPACPSRRR